MIQSLTIPPGQRCLFIADLHLDPVRDDTYALALNFISQARAAQQLFILGDLFEYWIGDDAGLAIYAPVIQSLRHLSDSGCRITVIPGNRDFLLGQNFAKKTGSVLITDDELLINLAGSQVLLMHGDTLCTDDNEYQAFRDKVRDPIWQNEFLALTVDERHRQAQAMRTQSQRAGSRKVARIMDVNQQQVLQRLRAHNCTTLIHGHTHRPDLHQLSPFEGRRFVLGDWQPDHAVYALSNGGALSLETFTAQESL